jgi:hypothetical protein
LLLRVAKLGVPASQLRALTAGAGPDVLIVSALARRFGRPFLFGF